jgi:hypothetical protein
MPDREKMPPPLFMLAAMMRPSCSPVSFTLAKRLSNGIAW